MSSMSPMSSPETFSLQGARRSKLTAAGRVVLVVLALVALLAVATVHWFRSAARSAMPQMDGTVVLAELHSPVTVVRDEHGVPSITALSLDDLFFAQGYVTAQDRLWQMDMTRRYASGELAAALGPAYVKVDREQRVLGLREVARHSLQQASPEVRAQLEAYARGVNAYIAEHHYGLPLEMRVLRYFPRAWTAEDSALVGAAMAEMLNHGTYLDDLNHEKTLAKLGPELTADLYVQRSQRDIIPGHDLDPIEPEAVEPDTAQESVKMPLKRRHHLHMMRGRSGRGEGRRHLRAELTSAGGLPPTLTAQIRRGEGGAPIISSQATMTRFELATMPRDDVRAGSNEWVISGAHTASGRPLLSNDMHLPHQIPNTWYEAHLTCGDYDVAGVTLPGAPWVIVGHNRRIAWGFTNLGPDVEDVYVENFNGAGEYQTPSGWQKPEVRHEVIHVKRGRDVEMDVVVTRHGPIVSADIHGENRQLALKWALLDTGLSLPFYALDSAQNWQQFRAALANFSGPGQNVVYADADGNIGYQAAGKVPVRASGDGSLPVSGADDAQEWTGYIPFDEMPSVYNPLSGIIATANGRVTPDGYKYSITTEWESPYRTERIYRVLRQNKKFTADDMLALQTDVQSDLDKFVAQRMAYALDQTPGASARARQAADILRRFDGKLSMDSAGAAIEQRARAWLMNTLLEDKLGNDAERYHWYMNTVWLENVVAFQPARWLPSEYPSWNALLAASVEAAVTPPIAPRDLASWKYGDYATVEIDHPIFGKLPWLRRYASTGRLPQSGNGITVKQVGGKFAPSERFTADFADLDHSTLNIVNGQSGNLFSPYFNDQFEAWYRGTTFGLAFKPETVEKTAAHRLHLVPQ
jgi:penicillin G amidase